MTPDLNLLREKLEDLSDLVDALEFELVDDPKWSEPSDTSYLNDKDRANPNIMANVEAMAATNQLIAWFGRDMEGYVGLWRGPNATPLDQAPVVRLDTEGQYAIVSRSIGDYFAIWVDEAEFDETRETLSDAGFEVRGSREEIWNSIKGIASPNDFRHRLYNEGRVKRGLEPMK